MGHKNNYNRNPNNPNGHSESYLDRIALGTNNSYWATRQMQKLASGRTSTDKYVVDKLLVQMELMYDEILYRSQFYKFSYEPLERAKIRIIHAMYLSNAIGLMKKDGEFLVYNISSTKDDGAMNILSGDARLFNGGNNTNPVLQGNKQNWTRGTFPMVYSNKFKQPWILYLKRYMEEKAEFVQAWALDLRNSFSQKAIAVESSDMGDDKELELREIYDNDNKRIIYVSGELKDSVMDLSTTSQQDDHWKNRKEWDNERKLMRGIRDNVNAKKDQNLMDELTDSEIRFIVIENHFKSILEDLATQVQRCYGTEEIKVTTIIEERDAKELAEDILLEQEKNVIKDNDIKENGVENSIDTKKKDIENKLSWLKMRQKRKREKENGKTSE